MSHQSVTIKLIYIFTLLLYPDHISPLPLNSSLPIQLLAHSLEDLDVFREEHIQYKIKQVYV